MINHARTLLLNVSGGSGFLGTLGEEIIPADYLSLNLSSALQSVRKVLFGATPDREMFNYRARQLMALLHATDLAEFVTDLDPRITYDLQDDPYFDNNTFVATADQVVGSGDQFSLLGTSVAPDASGLLKKVWDVTVASSSNATVQLRSPLTSSTEAYTITSGLSDAVPLVGSDLSVMFGAGVGNKWVVTSRVRPAADLGSIAATLETIGEPVLLGLFGVGSAQGATEPFKTFRNLWNHNNELPYKLGGLLLALIYQTEAIRNG